MTNPYESPVDDPAASEYAEPRRPSLVRAMFWSCLLCFVGGIVGLFVGRLLGGFAYDLYPAYYTDVVYEGRFGSGESDKVRMIVLGNTALNGGGVGLLAGLLLPWLRYAWLRWRHHRG